MKKVSSIVMVMIFALMICMCGCKDATKAQWSALGARHRITIYSGGQVVKIYMSTGNINFHGGGTAAYFEDAATSKLVEIAGTWTSEQE